MPCYPRVLRLCRPLSLALGGLTFGCGSDNSRDSEEARLCMAITEKFNECKIDVDTSMGCQSNLTEEETCYAHCLAEGDCTEITGKVADNSYFRCQAGCSAAGPDAFICLDGSGFLTTQGVCDGSPQCRDGSDEASCPTR